MCNLSAASQRYMAKWLNGGRWKKERVSLPLLVRAHNCVPAPALPTTVAGWREGFVACTRPSAPHAPLLCWRICISFLRAPAICLPPCILYAGRDAILLTFACSRTSMPFLTPFVARKTLIRHVVSCRVTFLALHNKPLPPRAHCLARL